MEKYNLQVGTRIDISRQVKLKNGDDSPVLNSKILDMIDEKTIIIAVPTDKLVSVPLPRNEEVSLFFYSQPTMLSARAVVIERFHEGNLPVLKMKLSSSLQKIQRRQFYRIDCHIPFHFTSLDEAQVKALLEFKGSDRNTLRKFQLKISDMAAEVESWVNGVILDLSGGGIRFITDKELKTGDTILVSLNLSQGEESVELSLVARLISVEEKREIHGKKEIRAIFYKLKDDLRDSIVKFVFDEERRLRKNLK